MRAVRFASAVAVLLGAVASGLIVRQKSGQANIRIDPATRFQTIQGWEAHAQSGEAMVENFDDYKNDLFDRAVNELGITRLRLEVRSGAENREDYWTPFREKRISYKQWRDVRYHPINDNEDPNVLDLSGFQFAELDCTIENVIFPIRKRLESAGKRLYVNLLMVDNSPDSIHRRDPREYAEFMLAMFTHMQSKYGFVPDAIEVVLEPNLAKWSPRQVAEAMVAAGDRLKEAGFKPEFIAPSCSTLTSTIFYFDEMLLAEPRVKEYWREVSYHRYGQGANTAHPALAPFSTRAAAYGLRTSMLERIGVGHEGLHQDLTKGNVAAWEQYALFSGVIENDDGGTYFLFASRAADEPATKVRLAARSRYIQQYTNYIRPGAVRIGADSNNASFEALSVVNPDGANIAIIKANRRGSIQIANLAAGKYGISYTTATELRKAIPARELRNGEALSFEMPGAGVATVFGANEERH